MMQCDLEVLQAQEAVTANITGAVLVVAMAALAAYLIWVRYKEYLAAEAARVRKAEISKAQLDMALQRLSEDKSDIYRRQAQELRSQIAELELENHRLRVRLDGIAKARR